MPLTDAQIKQIKPPKDTGKHFDGGGLYLELTTTGAKYWRLKYRFEGKENRISFGVYPEVGLKDARGLMTDDSMMAIMGFARQLHAGTR